MRKLKTLDELTIKDNFMFGAVMCNEEICREFLEMVLGFPIERVTVCKEKSMVYHPEYKGIRLDVMANRELGGRYMILREMLAAEYAEGKAEGKAESIIMLLELKGVVSEDLKVQILAQNNEKILDIWLSKVALCVSVEEFIESIKII